MQTVLYICIKGRLSLPKQLIASSKTHWKSKAKVIITQFLPNALCPSCLQTTLASTNLLLDVPHTVPQALLAHISNLPSSGEEPPDSLTLPLVQLA